MKLSHESRMRLGIGAVAFAVIILLIVSLSSVWNHALRWSIGLLDDDDVSDLADVFDGDFGKFDPTSTELSNASFDADAFNSLDLDMSSGTVEVKVIDGDKVRIIERGRIARGMSASKAATKNLAQIEGPTLKIAQFGSDDDKAIDRRVTVEVPRSVAEQMASLNARVRSGDLKVAGVTCKELNLNLSSGDFEFKGSATDKLTAEVGSGDMSISLNRAPSTSMSVREGSGDVEIEVPHDTGFTASLTLGSGDFESDFLSDDIEDPVENKKFSNGDKSADYRFTIGSGDMSFDAR